MISTISLTLIEESNWAAWYSFIRGFVNVTPIRQLDISFKNNLTRVRRPFCKKEFWVSKNGYIYFLPNLIWKVKELSHFDQVFSYEVLFYIILLIILILPFGAVITEEIADVLNKSC